MGYYPVTMGTLNLLLRLIHGIGIAKDADTQTVSFLDLAACLVFVMREVFAGFHKWRFAAVKDREEIGAVLSSSWLIKIMVILVSSRFARRSIRLTLVRPDLRRFALCVFVVLLSLEKE